MTCFVIFAFLIYSVSAMELSKKGNCGALKCRSNGSVCAIRPEGGGFKLRLFQSECALMHNQCTMDNFGFKTISMYYCSQTFGSEPNIEPSQLDPCEEFDCLHPIADLQVCGLRQDGQGYRIRIFSNKCELWKHNCINNINFTITDFYICNGIKMSTSTEVNNITTNNMSYKNNVVAKKDIEHIVKKDQLPKDKKYISQHDTSTADIAMVQYNMTFNKEANGFMNNANIYPSNYIKDSYNNYSINSYFSKKVMNRTDVVVNKDDEINFKRDFESVTMTDDNPDKNKDVFKNVIVIPGLIQDWNSVNETINHFFSATHVFDLPVREMPTSYFNEDTRRRLIKSAGPVIVHIPARIIPSNISDDVDHRATLHTCFHKCPTTCPATYAPVCGVPGSIAREPSLMFLNHCFMDVAQCKQYWENKSPTSKSSAYSELSFVFCLGDALSSVYKFLPLLKTLQHMGRLPRKGRYRFRLSNLKHFNNMLRVKNPNLMG